MSGSSWRRRLSVCLLLLVMLIAPQPVSALEANPGAEGKVDPATLENISDLLDMKPSQTQGEAAPPGPAPKIQSVSFNAAGPFDVLDFSEYAKAAKARTVTLPDPLKSFPKATQPTAEKEYRIKLAQILAPNETKRADPTAVAAWWKSLTPNQQRALIEKDPKLIGSLSGIPNDVRNEANRKALVRDISLTKEQLARSEAELKQLRAEWVSLRSRNGVFVASGAEAMLQNRIVDKGVQVAALRRRLKGATELQKQLLFLVEGSGRGLKQSDIYLLDYDTAFSSGEGRAIVSIGDPSKAKYIGVEVPGITNNLSNVGGLLQNAANLKKTIRDQFRQPAANESAVVMWLGYNTPNNLVRGAPVPTMATTGARLLKEFVGDLRTNYQGPQPPKITVFGHSYGSTTTGLAASMGMDADEIVLLGSPGAGVMRAAEMFPRSGRVWAARTDNDPIKPGAYLSFLKRDPMNPKFGAQIVPLDPPPMQSGHSDYYKFGSLGLQNFARIMMGEPPKARGSKG